jgi:hypothetical protein
VHPPGKRVRTDIDDRDRMVPDQGASNMSKLFVNIGLNLDG